MRPLPRSFFVRPPDQVAPDLIGKLLVRLRGGREERVRIVETEAYMGENDAAAHAAAGLTRRTAILFGPPGRAYIYLIYGLHLCLNVATLPDGQAGGVLFRAAVSDAPDADPKRYSGPGRLTQALGITADLNGHDLTRHGPLYLAADGAPVGRILAGPRVGIRKAVELPYRYSLAGSRAVSAPRPRE